MTESQSPNPRDVLDKSRIIASREQVADAIKQMADAINEYYRDRSIIVLAVMTGAIMPVAWITSLLKMPLRMDFIHATRYQGQTEGGELEFRVPPRLNLQDQDVLIVDDIYDVGLTLQLIEKYCEGRSARSVNSAVLVRKLHDRWTTGELPRFIGMDLEDKYIFGCGMDAYEHWRHLDQIYALDAT
jgi:hypoxanthine phosphoribosyltransferase